MSVAAATSRLGARSFVARFKRRRLMDSFDRRTVGTVLARCGHIRDRDGSPTSVT